MLEADGSGIVFSTYFGGEGMENCSSVSRSRENLIAISGATGSSNLPLVRPLRSIFANGEGYVAALDFTTELHLTVTAPAEARLQRSEPWSFNIENRGAHDATDVVLSLEFSQPVEARDLNAACTVASSDEIRCTIPTLALGNSVVISGAIAATEPGTISLAAKVTAAELLRGRGNVDVEVPVTTPRRRAAPSR